MDPLTILMMASAGIKFAREAVPMIRDAFANGTIPPEKQQAARDEYESLRKQLGGEYQGTHWELSGR